NRRRVTGVIAGLLVGVSLLGVARPGRAEPRTPGAAPAALSGDDWQNIGAQIPERAYRLQPAAGGGRRAGQPAHGGRGGGRAARTALASSRPGGSGRGASGCSPTGIRGPSGR